MKTVADHIVEALAAAKIEVVFGLPGGENVFLLEALRAGGIRFVLVRNESSAVYMAAAHARISGRPGVCLTTLGPGVVNGMAGLGHAFLDRVPLVFIAAAFDETLRPHHTHQYLDQLALTKPIVKKGVTLNAANGFSATAEALTLCQAGRPGPVFLQISKRMSGQPAPLYIESDPATRAEIDPVDSAVIEAIANRLSRATRPLIVAGLGLEPQRPYDQLVNLAEKLGAPVILTPKAKGAIPADHPLAAGTLGLTRTDPVYQIMAQSDCIIAVGFDVVELVKPWDESADLIWIAPWPNIDPVLPAVLAAVGDVPELLQMVGDAVLPPANRWGAAAVDALRTWLANLELPDPAYGLMRPQTVLAALRGALPHGTPLSTDVGSHKILAALTWPSYVPNRYLLSNGLSCMGYGLPAAIGASLALGGEPAVALHGDGGLAMAIGELGVVAELDLPIIVVVMNDEALDLIRAAQKRVGYPPFGTTFGGTEWVKTAAGFGIDGVRVTTLEACRLAIEDGLSRRKPLLIEAMIDPISYPTTP